jgi:colanic acid biosynthesis glycosyl transferase WcaI
MPRVLFLSQFFPPETFAGANRVASIVNALACSYDVVVVTLKPSYPDPALYDEQKAVAADSQRPYRVERCFYFVPHSRSAAIRALREQVMAARMALRAAREPADIVITSSPSMFLGPVCWLLARTKASRFAWDIRDIGWEYAGESQRVSTWMRPLLKILQRAMWSIVGRADLIVAATPGIAEQVSQKVTSSERILVVGNTVTKAFLDASKICRERVGKPRPIVAYVGLIGDAQGLEVLADVAHLLPEVDFVVAGEGPERDLLQRRMEELRLSNLRLTGYLESADVLDVYRKSDILFAQLRDTPTLNATGLPSKLHEYMATGKPILYAGKGLARATVERIGCGVGVEPEASTAIAEAIEGLLRDDTRREEMGRRGRRHVESSTDSERGLEAFLAALREGV